jgi:transposase
MAQPEPIITPTQHPETPECVRCGNHMVLTMIEPEKPEHDRRTFECPMCGFTMRKVVKFK